MSIEPKVNIESCPEGCGVLAIGEKKTSSSPHRQEETPHCVCLPAMWRRSRQSNHRQRYWACNRPLRSVQSEGRLSCAPCCSTNRCGFIFHGQVLWGQGRASNYPTRPKVLQCLHSRTAQSAGPING